MTKPTDNRPTQFSEAYGSLLEQAVQLVQGVSETADSRPFDEAAVQALWFEQAYTLSGLRTREGHQLEVVSPGWWNHHAGPDFRGAQLAFNGELFTGDVEVHLSPEGWQAHGHHLDRRYDEVILHVVMSLPAEVPSAHTASGRPIPVLVLGDYVERGWELTLDQKDTGEAQEAACGACSRLIPNQGVQPLTKALDLAAEWRLLNKARVFRERMDRAGANQAVYEAAMYAAGFSAFKHHFQVIARHLPYDRAVQLAQHDPLLLEAAMLQLGGLLPDALPEDAPPVPHHARLTALRREHLSGMRSLPLQWKRVGLRPANYPERRLAGMARVLSRTSQDGLFESVMNVWRQAFPARETREAFTALFPRAMGFWATHYTWTGKALDSAAAPLGSSRIHSMIGNVFIPIALAAARQKSDRALEERILHFLQRFPKEGNNHVLDRMIPKLTGDSGATIKLNFQRQQGMLQFYQDWCGPNPSCRNCTMLGYLDQSKE